MSVISRPGLLLPGGNMLIPGVKLRARENCHFGQRYLQKTFGRLIFRLSHLGQVTDTKLKQLKNKHDLD